MAISPHTLDTLEFPKVLQRLATYASFSASKELALSLRPATDVDEVRARQRRTSECVALFDDHPDVSIGGARDVRAFAQRARRGGVLEAPMFLELAATLGSARRLKSFLRKLDAERFPFLAQTSEELPSLQAIEDAIARTIGDDGTVLDSASPALGRLRGDIRVAYGRLQDKLQSIISSTQYASTLQEPLITMRNGRYVVPVKAAQRRNLRGLVHDQSGSGATLYIEPMAVVELNNKLRELQLAEEEEVQRILGALSEQVGAEAVAIIGGVEALARLDLFFAQARYSVALRCVEPEVVVFDPDQPPADRRNPDDDGSPLLLSAARHPLLDQSKVVPTTMRLGGGWKLLLITGPNTGGKTVALKTTGLLALMAQAGLHIPATAPSRIPIFGQVFADIGDEQSIEQSLSTFSSHMTNIIRILRALDGEPVEDRRPQTADRSSTDGRPPTADRSTANGDGSGGRRSAVGGREQSELGGRRSAVGGREQSELGGRRSAVGGRERSEQSVGDGSDWYTVLSTDDGPALVLLDELGAGTDPVEGAALARSIIERLLERGCLGVATTHYAELKAFAYSTPGVQNASVEFDIETLAPTYRLTIGLPGRSNALAIAQRLGLDAGLVERARTTVAREDAQVEDLLAGIHREREQAEQERAATERLREDAEKYRERLARELREFEASREQREQQARDELENELRDVRGQLRRLRDDFRSVSLTRQWMEEAEQRIEQAKTGVQEAAQKSAKRPSLAPPPPPQPQGPRPLEVGDTVLVRSVGLTGEIVAIDEEEQAADVQVGGFRMRADLKELRREKRSPEDERRARYSSAPAISAPAAPDVSMSFDMRGWRASEVADKLDRYLNDAYLASLPQVRLIHGKGTGALRQVVRDVLQGHPLVASFGGGGQDGGDGVTVARLVDR